MRGVADDFDISRALAQPLAGRDAAWRFIEGYAEAWLSPITANDGYDDVDLDEQARSRGVGADGVECGDHG